MKGDIPKWFSWEGIMYRSRGTRLLLQCVPIYSGIHVFWPQWFFSFRFYLFRLSWILHSLSDQPLFTDEFYLSNEEKCYTDDKVSSIFRVFIATVAGSYATIVSMQEKSAV